MCGIATIVTKRAGRAVDPEELGLMASVLAHRGPDECGSLVTAEGRVGLAHVRLSIIDLEHGHQPMTDAEGVVSVSFNGELYDYREHRRDLLVRGHVFRTDSDTEVLLRLYREYGCDFVTRLNGEFAFVLWDAEERRLLVARDRFGIKPLFFRETADEILIASEQKALCALPRVERRISKEYLTTTFCGAFPEATALLDGVRCVPPAHVGVARLGDELRFQRYWRFTFKVDERMSFRDATDGVRTQLEDAVRRRLVADVPVGVYLSGGVDSTLVCGLAASEQRDLRAFNFGFPGSSLDETSAAQRNAGHFGVECRSLHVSLDDLAQTLARTLYHCEGAVMNPNACAKLLLSAFVRQSGYKVCLTGEGADEVFAGYPYFKLEELWRMELEGGSRRQLARSLWRDFMRIEKRSEGLAWDRGGQWRTAPRLLPFPSFIEMRIRNLDFVIQRLFDGHALGLTARDRPFEQWKRLLDLEELARHDPLNASKLLSMNQLTSHVFPIVGDRVEMANSVECRLPFLDTKLVEFAETVPPRYFIEIEQLREKNLLHHAFAGFLPPAMGEEHKHPFLAPDWDSFYATRHGRELFEEYLSLARLRACGIFNPSFVRRLFLAWRLIPKRTVTKKRLNMALGAILSMQMLHEMFVTRRPEPAVRLRLSEPPMPPARGPLAAQRS
jgi:asparagine synthase (glutamine-hydrolysing)